MGIINGKWKAAALVRAAAGGDKDAFVRLIDQYRQTMYATAMAVTHSEDDAMDAIQETVLILWEKLDTLKDPAAFKTWMTRILVNCCCGFLRGSRRQTPVEELEEQGEERDLDTSLDVQNALSALPEDDRLVLQLYYFEDMPAKDVARALGLTPEAVRMRLSRGRKRFKEQYEKGGEARYENRNMKMLLERELPYPQLTIRADKRFDEILANLPERASSPKGAAADFSGDGPWEDCLRGVAEPIKRSFGAALGKYALAFASLALVGLIALNCIAPAVAESLPVVGGAFQTVNGFFRGESEVPQPVPTSDPSPTSAPVEFRELPVEDNGATLLKAELTSRDYLDNCTLTCTASLPYLGFESWNLLEYDPDLIRTPEGKKATLHFPDGSIIYGLGFIDRQPGTASVDGEKTGPTITWDFLIDPKYLGGPVVLAIPERNSFAADEESSGRRIVAEFTLDLATDKASANGYTPKAAVTENYKTGYFGSDIPSNKVTPEEALAAPRNGEFTRDWYALQPVSVPGPEQPDGGRESGYRVTFFQRNINTEGLGPATGVYRGEDWDSVTLNYYVNEALVGSVPVCSREEMNEKGLEYSVTDGGFLNEPLGNAKVYHLGNREYLDILADPELTGGDYRRLSFFVPASALGLPDIGELEQDSYNTVRFELVDSDGSVIFADALGAAEAEYCQATEAYHELCKFKGPYTAPEAACSPLPVEDNGTTLTSIVQVGSTVGITAEIPYMGRMRDSLDIEDYYDYTLFGSTAYLTWLGEGTQRADATQVEGEHMEEFDGYQLFQQSPGMEDRMGETRTVMWSFSNVEVPENGQLLLTLYEKVPPSEGELNRPNRITAQFMVDLDTGEAAPADYSKPMGLVKATPEEVFNTPRTAPLFGDWFPAGMGCVTFDGAEYCKLVFYQKNVDTESISNVTYSHPDWEPATLRAWLDDELKTEITALSRKNLEASGQKFEVRDGAFLDENLGNARHYRLENGMFYENTATFSGTKYRRLVFGMPASALGLENGQLAKFVSDGRLSFDLGQPGGEMLFFFDVENDRAAQRLQDDKLYEAFCQVDEYDPYRERMVMEANCSGHQDYSNPSLCPTPNLDASQYSCYIQLFVNTVSELDDWEIYVEQADGTATTYPLTPGDTSIQPPEANIDEENMWHPLASGPMYRLDWRTPTPDEYEEWITVNLWKGLDLPRRCYMLTLYQNGADGKTYDWNDAIWRLQTTGEDPKIIRDRYGDWRPSDGPFVLNGALPKKTSPASSGTDGSGTDSSGTDDPAADLEPDTDEPAAPTPTPEFLCDGYPVGGWISDGSGHQIPVYEVTPTPTPTPDAMCSGYPTPDPDAPVSSEPH